MAVLLTASGKFVFMDFLDWKLPFIIVAILGWTTYIVQRQKKVPGLLSYWGFRLDNFTEVGKMVMPFGLIAVALFIIIGYFQNTLNLNWHLIPILILYPLWGAIQQFLVIGLFAGNLIDLKKPRLNKYLIILLNAVVFAAVHYPTWWLIIGTFVLALFYGFIYLRSRNVYVLGIFHGWLGGLFFFTVVDKDPFLQVFGSFIK